MSRLPRPTTWASPRFQDVRRLYKPHRTRQDPSAEEAIQELYKADPDTVVRRYEESKMYEKKAVRIEILEDLRDADQIRDLRRFLKNVNKAREASHKIATALESKGFGAIHDFLAEAESRTGAFLSRYQAAVKGYVELDKKVVKAIEAETLPSLEPLVREFRSVVMDTIKAAKDLARWWQGKRYSYDIEDYLVSGPKLRSPVLSALEKAWEEMGDLEDVTPLMGFGDYSDPEGAFVDRVREAWKENHP